MATINGGYLNFMGNEFGHPEWIDFPREGNGWSYKHALRRWDLADREDLWYADLNSWNANTVALLRSTPCFTESSLHLLLSNVHDQVLAFERQDLLFVFNLSSKSYQGYRIPCTPGVYSLALSNVTPNGLSSTIDCSASNDGGCLYLDIAKYGVCVYKVSRCK